MRSIRWIYNAYVNHPLLFALGLGLIFRLLQAILNYTPAQNDDYANVIRPALRHLQTGEGIYLDVYRLGLLPRLFYLFMLPAHWLGSDNPRVLVSCAYGVVGLLSSFGIYGMHRLGQNFLSPVWLRRFTLIGAIYFLMPFLATRVLISTLAMTILPLGFYYLTKQTVERRDYIFAGALFGIATLMRFQVGLLVLFTTGFFIYQTFKKQAKARLWLFFFVGGLTLPLLLGLSDLMDGRIPGSTVYKYIHLLITNNLIEGNFTGNPWHTYLGILMLIFIPPFSIAMLYPLAKGIRENYLLLINFAGFLLFHTIVHNRQERFIFPILPLFMLFTFIGLQKLEAKKWVRYSFWGFFIANLIFLPLAVASRSQLNTVDAALFLRHETKPVVLWGVTIWQHGYQGFDKRTPWEISTLAELDRSLEKKGENEFYLFTIGDLGADRQAQVDHYKYQCKVHKTFSPDFLEWLAVKANPGPNARRRTSYLRLCRRPLPSESREK